MKDGKERQTREGDDGMEIDELLLGSWEGGGGVNRGVGMGGTTPPVELELGGWDTPFPAFGFDLSPACPM